MKIVSLRMQLSQMFKRNELEIEGQYNNIENLSLKSILILKIFNSSEGYNE